MTGLVEVRAALAGIGGLEIVTAESGCDVADIVCRLRAVEAEIALLLIDSSTSAMDRAMLCGAIGPLAIERAPQTRIGAIELGEGAATADIVDTASFLASARSTTGQVLTVTAET